MIITIEIDDNLLDVLAALMELILNQSAHSVEEALEKAIFTQIADQCTLNI